MDAKSDPGSEALVIFHPRLKEATQDELARLANFLTLTGPVPSYKFLQDGEEGEAYQPGKADMSRHAGD